MSAALLEGPSAENELVWEAHLEGMAPEIDGKVFITDMAGVNDVADLPSPGTMATVEYVRERLRSDRPGGGIRIECGCATLTGNAGVPNISAVGAGVFSLLDSGVDPQNLQINQQR